MEANFYHIDDLLVKYLLEEVTPDEKKQVENWILSDAANKKHYEDFKLIWNESKRLEKRSMVNEEEAWQRFQNRVKTRQLKPLRKMQFSWMRIAALFILITGAGLLAYNLLDRDEEAKTIALLSKEMVITDTLPDGSVVTLNKNSSLSYPEVFSDTIRSIKLSGEAFFNVSPNKKKPFVIHVNDVQIRVVGTSFNVKSSNATTEVIVETGIVEVKRQTNTVRLIKDEKIIVKQDSVLKKDIVEDKLYNYYRTKEFACDETPLWKLVTVLNEAYNAQIVIENKSIRNLPLTTTFNNESLDNILKVISETFSITVSKEGNKIVLK